MQHCPFSSVRKCSSFKGNSLQKQFWREKLKGSSAKCSFARPMLLWVNCCIYRSFIGKRLLKIWKGLPETQEWHTSKFPAINLNGFSLQEVIPTCWLLELPGDLMYLKTSHWKLVSFLKSSVYISIYILLLCSGGQVCLLTILHSQLGCL